VRARQASNPAVCVCACVACLVVGTQPLQQIQNAHVRDCSNTSSSRTLGAGTGTRGVGAGRGGTGTTRSKKSPQAPPSVTSVVFIDEYVLASAGANDGAVKLWDLRKSWNHEVPCVVLSEWWIQYCVRVHAAAAAAAARPLA